MIIKSININKKKSTKEVKKFTCEVQTIKQLAIVIKKNILQ